MKISAVAMWAGVILCATTCTAQSLELWVDPPSGAVSLHNTSFGGAQALDGYSVQSFTGSLNPAGFAGFAAHGVSGWSPTGQSTHGLSELNLTSSSTLSLGGSYSLSNAYTSGSARDLTFQYSGPASPSIYTGAVVYTDVPQLRVIGLLGNGGAAITSTAAIIMNGATSSMTLDAYEISSASGSLHSAGFSGFAGHNVAGWQSVAPTSGILTELNLTGSSTLNTGNYQSLGSIFSTNGVQDLSFKYSDPSSAGLLTGTVLYSAQLAGDVNNDGVVNAADITIIASHWLQTNSLLGDANYDGVVNVADITLVASNWLNTLGSGGGLSESITVAGVPEPETLTMLLIGIAACAPFARRLRKYTASTSRACTP